MTKTTEAFKSLTPAARKRMGSLPSNAIGKKFFAEPAVLAELESLGLIGAGGGLTIRGSGVAALAEQADMPEWMR